MAEMAADAKTRAAWLLGNSVRWPFFPRAPAPLIRNNGVGSSLHRRGLS